MSLDETRATSPQDVGRVPAARAALVVLHSADRDLQGNRVELGEEDVTLGREAWSEATTIVLSASRRHARVFVSGGAHVLVDLESTNGTYVNSKLVKEQTLRHGDVLRVATTVLRYVVES
jgi:pSer/pThr/pTyr-binding forkhead associated (FHA) protein